jgi:diacylglycerol kinase family enzyme
VDEAFGLLASAGRVVDDAVIEVQTAGGGRHFAFNVCSFGLDAYVCELSNRMKKWGPRSVYKVFADLAVFRYEKIYPLRPWVITVDGPDGRIVREGRYLLTVFGRKGGTRYGGGMKVLPGEENFLLVDPVGLMTKLRIKPLFYRGAHRGLPIAELFRANELTLDHMGDILMELDGEVVPLKREDFPLKVRRLPGALNVLS